MCACRVCVCVCVVCEVFGCEILLDEQGTIVDRHSIAGHSNPKVFVSCLQDEQAVDKTSNILLLSIYQHLCCVHHENFHDQFNTTTYEALKHQVFD